MIATSYNTFLTLLVLCLAYKFIKAHYEKRADERLAASKGCQSPRKWNSTWPLGLDMLLKAFKYESKKHILQFFLEVMDENGHTFEQKLLFARGIDTIDPENIEAVLSSQFEDFGLGLRPLHFDPLMGSGIFTQDGAQWRHSRQLLRPQFMSNRFNNLEQVKTAVQNLIDGVPDNAPVDLQPLFFRLTFDTTLFLLFGKYLPSLKSEGITDRESEFAEAFNTGQDYLAQRGRLGDFYWLLGGLKFRRACRICHDFVDGAVQKALESSTEDHLNESREAYTFIDALIQESRDPKFLRSQCMNILLAGRDTTACCLTWALRLLVQHPNVLSKLRREINHALGIGPKASEPTINQLKKLSYLSNVIKEVLRLYPSVPVNSRAAIRTTTLPTGGGPYGTDPILIRKGEAVGYSVYAMHRRKDIYGADAESFRPERWADPTILSRVGNWGYLPFNGGPRVCLGQEFALLEVGYTIVRIVQVFQGIEMEGVEWPVVGQEEQVLTLVVASGEGCWVRMRRY